MKTSAILAGAAGLLAASSLAAFAAEVSGTISGIDPTASSVTLDNGKVYFLPTKVSAAPLLIGQKVTITFESAQDGKLTASEVKPAA